MTDPVDLVQSIYRSEKCGVRCDLVCCVGGEVEATRSGKIEGFIDRVRRFDARAFSLVDNGTIIVRCLGGRPESRPELTPP